MAATLKSHESAVNDAGAKRVRLKLSSEQTIIDDHFRPVDDSLGL